MKPLELTVLTRTVSVTSDEVTLGFSQDGSSFVQFDHMVRLSTDHQTQSVVARSWETPDFMRGVYVWANEKQSEVDLLVSFAAWQKRKLDYDGVYTAWLLDAMSEDEFVEEAKKYAVVLGEKDPQYVAGIAEKLVGLLPFEITTADLAEFLQTEPRSVLAAIAKSGKSSEKLKALLPGHKLELDNQ